MMRMNNSKKVIGGFIFALGLLASTASIAWHGHHGGGHHGGGPRHEYGNTIHRGLSYGNGYFYGGGGWGGPEVIINVPAPNYYVPRCNTIEVCDPYGACWLENSCR